MRSLIVRSKSSGFTLVELLVVVSVIGILIAMLFPAIQAVRAIARKTSCTNNLRQIVLGLHAYESANSKFPIPVDENGGSLFLELTAHLDQEYIYKKFREDLGSGETWEDRLQTLSDIRIPTLNCPGVSRIEFEGNVSNTGRYTTQYYGVAGPVDSGQSADGLESYTYEALSPEPSAGPISLDGLFGPDDDGKYSRFRGFEDIRDGKSNTLAFGEISYEAERLDGTASERAGWAFGAKLDSNDVVEKQYFAKTLNHEINDFEKGDTNDPAFGSVHAQGAHFAFADGSVNFLNERIPLNVLKTLASISTLEKPEEYDQY